VRKFIDSLQRETVAVHLSDGASLKGVLLACHRDCLVLAHAVTLSADGGQIPVDGEAVLPRERILWLQRLMPEATT